MSTATGASRMPNWRPTPPPPPSPKILNLPRRNRHRRHHKKPTRNPPFTSSSDPKFQHHHSQEHLLELHPDSYYYCSNDRKGKLERLFGEEREFSRSDTIVLFNSSPSAAASGRRDRVENEVEEEAECGGGNIGILEEKWKFQAEILRAECKFLRKERELAFKKLERNRKRMEKTLHSALQTLISGKEKIFDGKNANFVLEEEIENLIQKLGDLQRGSGNKDLEIKSSSNFDKQASVLQRRLEKLGGLSEDQCVKDLLANVGKESCVSGPRNHVRFTDVEMLRLKMEGLSKEMLDKFEEDCESILSTTANSSAASSASTSKRIEYPDSMFSTGQLYQEPLAFEDSKCSGRCKAIVRKIVEQVRAETEQWSQMQAMLGKVREEMHELQASRDSWEHKSLKSEREVQFLQSNMQEWKEKALSFETKANKLQQELSSAKGEIHKLRTTKRVEPGTGDIRCQTSCLVPLSKQIEEENLNEHFKIDVKRCDKETAKKLSSEATGEAKPSTKPQPISLGKQLEKEKRMLLRRLKEKHKADVTQREVLADQRIKSYASNSEGLLTRSPFRDIGNFSPLMR